MAKLKSVLGYTGAALSIVIMLVGVSGFGMPLGELFVKATGLVTSANWSGGEVAQTV
jgi:hypothetical protein